MQKQPLSPIVRNLLINSYGSIAAAARELEFEDYQRLRKSVLRNSFSAALLAVLFPDKSVADLRNQYEFRVTRMNSLTPTAAKSYRHLFINLISNEDCELLSENALIRERVSKLIGEECSRFRKVFTDLPVSYL